jgi:hypothetical protein
MVQGMTAQKPKKNCNGKVYTFIPATEGSRVTHIKLFFFSVVNSIFGSYTDCIFCTPVFEKGASENFVN